MVKDIDNPNFSFQYISFDQILTEIQKLRS